MTDLREGRIQAFLESEMLPKGRRQFIAEMASDQTLADAVEAQRQRIERVSSALDVAFGSGSAGELDPDDVEEAWTAVAARVGVESQAFDLNAAAAPVPPSRTQARGATSQGWRLATPVAKAAGLLLVAAGAASAAIPGSPLRQWAEAQFFSAAVVPAASVEESVDPPPTGLQLPVFAGTRRVLLRDPLTTQVLTIRLVDGDVFEVLAGSGTRFSTSEDRIEVTDVHGPITIRIPRAQSRATIEVAGVVYLRKAGERVEVLQAGADSLPSEFIFSPTEQDPIR